ncbi:MAG: sulfotransferase domain-containing protein [Rhodospirillales bacterium]|nr:sulfotransferase domain-containing protein [Rhodospirillales bacterium]
MGRILWLASYPKSGNTWVRVFLANLLIGDGNAPVALDRLGEATLSESGTTGFARFDDRPWTEWSHDDIAAMRPRVQERIASTGDGAVPVKTHSAFVMAKGAPVINMAVTSGVVYIVRNPLDVAISYADHQGLGVDAIIGIMATDMFRTPTNEHNVFEVMGSWTQHVRSWTGSSSPMLHIMRYEDMLADPEPVFTRLVSFMRIGADDAAVRRAVDLSSFDRVRAQETSEGFRERTPAQAHFFRSGKAGQWRDRLTRDQVARIVGDHREQMARFGYCPGDEAT